MTILSMGAKSSSEKAPIGHLVQYFKVDGTLFTCKLCGASRKNASRTWIYKHFVPEKGKIRCVNLQQCPKCRDFVSRKYLDWHLKEECRYSDVYFMRCEACWNVINPLFTPHQATDLGCMHYFLEKFLKERGFNPKKFDLNDLYGPQLGLTGPGGPQGPPKCLADLVFFLHQPDAPRNL